VCVRVQCDGLMRLSLGRWTCNCVFLAPQPFYHAAQVMWHRSMGLAPGGRGEGQPRVLQVAGKVDVPYCNNGEGWEARFDTVCGMAFSEPRGALIIADTGNNRVRMVVLKSPFMVSTVSGGAIMGHRNGKLRHAQFNMPYDVAVDASGSMIYVTDYRNQALRAINLHAATVQTLYLCNHLQHPTSIRIEKNAYLIVVCATTERVFRFGIRTSSSADISPNAAGARHATQIQVTPNGNVLMYRARVDNAKSLVLSVRDPVKAGILFSIDVVMPLLNICFVQDTMYALLSQRLHKIHFELDPDVLKMLYLAVHTCKPELHGTPSPMALLSFCLLRIVIGFTNRPFYAPVLEWFFYCLSCCGCFSRR